MGVIFVTHDLGVAGEIADRVAVMYAGKVVEEGPVDALMRGPLHPVSARPAGRHRPSRHARPAADHHRRRAAEPGGRADHLPLPAALRRGRGRPVPSSPARPRAARCPAGWPAASEGARHAVMGARRPVPARLAGTKAGEAGMAATGARARRNTIGDALRRAGVPLPRPSWRSASGTGEWGFAALDLAADRVARMLLDQGLSPRATAIVAFGKQLRWLSCCSGSAARGPGWCMSRPISR